MSLNGPRVATLLARASAQARIRNAVDPSIPVVHCSSAREAVELVRAADIAVVVIDAVSDHGLSSAPIVATLHASAPRLAILAFCSPSPGSSSAMLACAQAGASGLLLEGVDDSRYAIQAALQSARIGSISEALYEELAVFLPQGLTPLLRYAVARVTEEPSVGDAAASLGVNRKTLANWLARYTTLGPREFINWIRLVITVGALETTDRTAEHVALDFGFASGTAFRNMLRRYTGATSTDARREGGARWLIGLFKAHFGQASTHRLKQVRDDAGEHRRSNCRSSARTA